MRHDTAKEHLDRGFPSFQSYPPNRLQRLAISLGQQLPQSYVGRRAAGWIRGIVQARATEPVDLEVLGMRMRLRLTDNSCERRLLVTPHFFEPDSLKELARRVRQGGRFVDIGANVGTYSLLAVQSGSGKTLAIEPNAALARRLRENVLLNGFDIAIEDVAAADYTGTMTLRRDGNNLGASTTLPHVKVRWQEPPLEVACDKMINLVSKHGFDRIDAMKIDIEGGEDKVLLAFLQEAPEHLWPKFLVVEDNAEVWDVDLVAELSIRGWSPVKGRGNLMFERTCLAGR